MSAGSQRWLSVSAAALWSGLVACQLSSAVTPRPSTTCARPAPRLALALGDATAQQLPLAAAANELYKRVRGAGTAGVLLPATGIAAAAGCCYAPTLSACLPLWCRRGQRGTGMPTSAL